MKLHIHEHKPTEAELIIEELLATIYLMRINFRNNQEIIVSSAEDEARKYLRKQRENKK